MNDKMVTFLKKQTAASISCVNEANEPYSFSCFFAFNSRENLLYYKSSPSAYHSKILLGNPKISGTILPDKLSRFAIKGIQFIGGVLDEGDSLCLDASKNYHSKFPLAFAIPGMVWTIRLSELRMTDNVLGIMEKYSWQRENKTAIEPA